MRIREFMRMPQNDIMRIYEFYAYATNRNNAN